MLCGHWQIKRLEMVSLTVVHIRTLCTGSGTKCREREGQDYMFCLVVSAMTLVGTSIPSLSELAWLSITASKALSSCCTGIQRFAAVSAFMFHYAPTVV